MKVEANNWNKGRKQDENKETRDNKNEKNEEMITEWNKGK